MENLNAACYRSLSVCSNWVRLQNSPFLAKHPCVLTIRVLQLSNFIIVCQNYSFLLSLNSC
jgi:hypothetical protein